MNEPFLVTAAFRGPLEEIQAGLPEGSPRHNQIGAILKHGFVPTRTSFHSQPIPETKNLRAGDLGKLSIEVRLMIYGYLLVNPILGTKDSIHTNHKLDLAPNILATCKKLYFEGMPVLYGQNKFYISCSRDRFTGGSHACIYDQANIDPSDCDICRGPENEDYPEMSSDCDHIHFCGFTPTKICNTYTSIFDLSPITRHWNAGQYPNGYIILADIPAMAYVEHWMTVMACRLVDGGRWGSVEFCRAICRGQAKSLEIALVPTGLVSRDDPDGEAESMLKETLRPMTLLRNLKTLIVRPALRDEFDYIGWDIPPILPLTKADMPIQAEEDRLRQLVTGNSDVERAHDMWPLLLAYAQTYERRMMHKLNLSPYSRTTSDCFPKNLPSVLGSHNIYFSYTRYPVELGLMDAEECISNREDSLVTFKALRADALNFLEPQFREICDARSAVVSLIDQEKIPEGFFDAQGMGSSWSGRELLERLAATLESYAETFDQKMFEWPWMFERWESEKAALEKLYSARPRERAMARFGYAVTTENSYEFKRMFQIAFDDIDKQFQSMCRTRERLFDFDFTDSGMVEDFWFPSEDLKKEVDWSVNGPRE